MESTLATGRHVSQAQDPALTVRIDYVNWRGERAVRTIVPRRLYFGEVDWHDGAQWLLDAWDVEKAAIRSFAVADIQQWGV